MFKMNGFSRNDPTFGNSSLSAMNLANLAVYPGGAMLSGMPVAGMGASAAAAAAAASAIHSHSQPLHVPQPLSLNACLLPAHSTAWPMAPVAPAQLFQQWQQSPAMTAVTAVSAPAISALARPPLLLQQQQQQQQHLLSSATTAAAAAANHLHSHLPPPSFPPVSLPHQLYQQQQQQQLQQYQRQQQQQILNLSVYSGAQMLGSRVAPSSQLSPPLAPLVQGPPLLAPPSEPASSEPPAPTIPLRALSPAAMRQREEIEQLKRSDAMFSDQFGAWQDEFDRWKEQNKGHMNEAQLSYQRDMVEMRDKLLTRRYALRCRLEQKVALFEGRPARTVTPPDTLSGAPHLPAPDGAAADTTGGPISGDWRVSRDSHMTRGRLSQSPLRFDHVTDGGDGNGDWRRSRDTGGARASSPRHPPRCRDWRSPNRSRFDREESCYSRHTGLSHLSPPSYRPDVNSGRLAQAIDNVVDVFCGRRQQHESRDRGSGGGGQLSPERDDPPWLRSDGGARYHYPSSPPSLSTLRSHHNKQQHQQRRPSPRRTSASPPPPAAHHTLRHSHHPPYHRPRPYRHLAGSSHSRSPPPSSSLATSRRRRPSPPSPLAGRRHGNSRSPPLPTFPSSSSPHHSSSASVSLLHHNRPYPQQRHRSRSPLSSSASAFPSAAVRRDGGGYSRSHSPLPPPSGRYQHHHHRQQQQQQHTRPGSPSHRRGSGSRDLRTVHTTADPPTTADRPPSKAPPPPRPPPAVDIVDLVRPPGRHTRPPNLVIILRGLPGSGKTHMAKLIKDEEIANKAGAPRILSLDDYFYVEREQKKLVSSTTAAANKSMVYEYDAAMEPEYRSALQRVFRKTVDDHLFSLIVLDCVNNRLHHFDSMARYAERHGFKVYIGELEADVSQCHARNVHHRSLSDLQRLWRSDWQPLPPPPPPALHPPLSNSGSSSSGSYTSFQYQLLDLRALLHDSRIQEVEMEDTVTSTDNDPVDDVSEVPVSKWEKMDPSEERLDKLDGVIAARRKLDSCPAGRPQTIQDYLQLADDYQQRQTSANSSSSSSGKLKKRVRWADVEQRLQQQKARQIGFVVGQTNWDHLTGPDRSQHALQQTKYI